MPSPKEEELKRKYRDEKLERSESFELKTSENLRKSFSGEQPDDLPSEQSRRVTIADPNDNNAENYQDAADPNNNNNVKYQYNSFLRNSYGVLIPTTADEQVISLGEGSEGFEKGMYAQSVQLRVMATQLYLGNAADELERLFQEMSNFKKPEDAPIKISADLQKQVEKLLNDLRKIEVTMSSLNPNNNQSPTGSPTELFGMLKLSK